MAPERAAAQGQGADRAGVPADARPGLLIGGVTGVAPARILVIGGGVVGRARRASRSAPKGR
ncbi:MAG: hypothetical protein ACLP0J_27925 [Solirubrobacteraceae bacterium]